MKVASSLSAIQSVMLRNPLEFKGSISRVSIVKLFKKMRFKVRIRLEEEVKTSVPATKPGEKDVIKISYRPLANSELSHDTEVTESLMQDKVFPDLIQFSHKVSYRDLSKQFLSFYLLDANSPQASPLDEAEVVSVYRIDLELLAIGPVHHSIDLKRQVTGAFSKSSQFSAKLVVDVKFVQT